MVLTMITQIEKISRRIWMISLARTPHFSEYVLYGVYADQVLGVEAAGLYPDANLPFPLGGDSFINAADEAAFISAIKPQHLSCNIQSTIETPLSKRAHLFERAVFFAAGQDERMNTSPKELTRANGVTVARRIGSKSVTTFQHKALRGACRERPKSNQASRAPCACVKPAPLEIRSNDMAISNSPRRRLEAGCDLDDLWVAKVKTGHSPIERGTGGFSFPQNKR